MAENKYGIGEPAETREVSQACELPGPPKTIHVDEISKTSATLSWSKPESNGGSPVTGYVLELQRVGMDAWITKSSVQSLQ